MGYLVTILHQTLSQSKHIRLIEVRHLFHCKRRAAKTIDIILTTQARKHYYYYMKIVCFCTATFKEHGPIYMPRN